MSKITDLLLDTLRHAEAGDRAGLDSNIARLRERHLATCRELLPPERQAAAEAEIARLIAEFERIAGGMLMLSEMPPRSVDEAVAIGERLSALLIAAYLNANDTPAEAVNAAEIVVTDAVFGNASPLMEPTRAKARARLLPLLERGVMPVVTGFNGATADGRPTTLGRGGSDFSASILSAALDASELWIWTDVDGIMTRRPAPDAGCGRAGRSDLRGGGRTGLQRRQGAASAHARAADRKERFRCGARTASLPKSRARASCPRSGRPHGARAVTSLARVALISLEPASPELSGAHVMARALDALDRANVEVLVFSSSSYRQNFCFLVRTEELEKSRQALESALALELAHDYVHPIQVDEKVGLLAVVGEGMQGKPGIAGRIFTAISRENVNIIAIAQGSSELTIAIVVSRDGLEKAVRAVHAECGLGR